MKQFRKTLISFLPRPLLNAFRPWRDRLWDLLGYFSLRRKFATNPVLVDVSASARAVLRPSKTILCYPERPRPGYRASEYAISALLGYAFTADPTHHFDVAFKRNKGAFFDPQILRAIPVSADRIVNARSVDISKETVARRFAEIFGYDLAVDPTQYHGKIVEKSNENATHDGRVLQGPIPAQAIRPGFVYQKEVDNTSEKKGMVLDYRVPIHGDQIPLVYLKYRPVEIRFANISPVVNLRKPQECFSPLELSNMILLARRMGIDFGEFDVLRDGDGRMYVVDTNHKPVGPPKKLPDHLGKVAFKLMTESFSQMLEQWAL